MLPRHCITSPSRNPHRLETQPSITHTVLVSPSRFPRCTNTILLPRLPATVVKLTGLIARSPCTIFKDRYNTPYPTVEWLILINYIFELAPGLVPGGQVSMMKAKMSTQSRPSSFCSLWHRVWSTNTDSVD